LDKKKGVKMPKLTEKEIEKASNKLKEILSSSDMTGEFHVGNKVYIEIYNEPRRK